MKCITITLPACPYCNSSDIRTQRTVGTTRYYKCQVTTCSRRFTAIITNPRHPERFIQPLET